MTARTVALFTLACILTAPMAGAQSRAANTESRSAIARLAPERLAAAHTDVERYASSRRELEPLPGLVDHRAIFHAHASDSPHTGGSLAEILADAKRAGVSIVLLSDHIDPERDFMNGWRGVRDGVLFIPGAEARGLLLHPESSVLAQVDEPMEELVARVERGAGMAFLSHVEERVDFPMDGLTGMEIYNRHADARDDRAALHLLAAWMTDPDGLTRLREILALYPAAVLASQVHRPELYLEKWDRENQQRRLVGIAANDCHHNQVFVVRKIDDESVRLGTVIDDEEDMRVLTVAERPRLREVTAGYDPGAEIARFDFDPYYRAMLDVSTHVLVAELDEAAVRAAVAAGRVYVSHDWLADPTGFRFTGRVAGRSLLMGDEIPYAPKAVLEAHFPLDADVRLLRNGEEISRAHTAHFFQGVEAPGVYRIEARLLVDGEMRPWIYSNPIFLREGVQGADEPAAAGTSGGTGSSHRRSSPGNSGVHSSQKPRRSRSGSSSTRVSASKIMVGRVSGS